MSTYEFSVPCLFGLEGIAGEELRRLDLENVRLEFEIDLNGFVFAHFDVRRLRDIADARHLDLIVAFGDVFQEVVPGGIGVRTDTCSD